MTTARAVKWTWRLKDRTVTMDEEEAARQARSALAYVRPVLDFTAARVAPPPPPPATVTTTINKVVQRDAQGRLTAVMETHRGSTPGSRSGPDLSPAILAQMAVAREHARDVEALLSRGSGGTALDRVRLDLLPATRRLVADLETAGVPLVLHLGEAAAAVRVVASAGLRHLEEAIARPFTAPLAWLSEGGGAALIRRGSC
jgi:hypothetical protein